MTSNIQIPSLSAAFRTRTRLLHIQAERSGIIRDLLVGNITHDGYALLLRNLLPAYEALEAGLEDRRDAAGFQLIANRDVYRAASIRADLLALCGAGWSESLPLLDAGRHYAARIAAVAAGDAFGLVAHAYARYLGDLNGGVILKRLLKQSLGLEPEALAFYDFPGVADLDEFKAGYRAAIDGMAQHIADQAPIAEEAANAFDLNIQVSEAVKAATTGDSDRVSGVSDSRSPAFDPA